MSSPLTRIASWAAAAAVGAGVFAAVSASGAVGTGRHTGGPATELVSAAAQQAEPDDKTAEDKATAGRKDRRAQVREKLAGRRAGGAEVGRRVVHGEFVVRTKDGFRTVFVHKGEVTEVSATSITVKRADGFTKAYPVTADTKVRSKGQPSTIGEVKTGNFAIVFGTRDGDAYTVRRIGVRPEPPAAPGAKPGAKPDRD